MTRTTHPLPTRLSRRRRLAAALAALAATATLVTACSGQDSSTDDSSGTAGERTGLTGGDLDGSGDSTTSRTTMDAEAAPATDGVDGGGVAADDYGSGGSAAAPGSPGSDVDLSTPAVISTGWVSLEADDVGDARFEVRKVVDAHRGTITEQETSTGEGGEVTSTRMVIRVPSARFADAFADLEATATLTDSSSSGEDVSAEVVDVAARVRAQRKSVARIEALLARAETIEQVVSVETQLATRQADLDALLSRQQWLADQTSQSTITVYVQQPDTSDEPDSDDADGFLGGLRDGWDAFVEALAAGAAALGYALPWLVALTLLGAPLWLAARRRWRRTPVAGA